MTTDCNYDWIGKQVLVSSEIWKNPLNSSTYFTVLYIEDDPKNYDLAENWHMQITIAEAQGSLVLCTRASWSWLYIEFQSPLRF